MTHRRTLLLAGAALATPGIVRAQAPWPTRPVTLVPAMRPAG